MASVGSSDFHSYYVTLCCQRAHPFRKVIFDVRSRLWALEPSHCQASWSATKAGSGREPVLVIFLVVVVVIVVGEVTRDQNTEYAS